MLKRILILLSMLMLMGCASVGLDQAQPSAISTDEQVFDCNQPKGREYVCYSEKECNEYFRGYGAVVVERVYMQRYHGWYPETPVHFVHINIFDDHSSWYYIGVIWAKRAGDEKVHMKMWLNIYDMDCNLLHKGFREGQLTQKHPEKKEKKSYEQNNFKLKTLGR